MYTVKPNSRLRRRILCVSRRAPCPPRPWPGPHCWTHLPAPRFPPGRGSERRGKAARRAYSGGVDVHYLDLACCGVEAGSAAARQAAAELADLPGPALVVVAGTVTQAAAPLVAAEIAGVPQPRLVVAYGVCTISGGPYWDSYAVHPVTADLVVPGCPPRPEALVAAVREALA